MARGLSQPDRHPSDTGYTVEECLTLNQIFQRAVEISDEYPVEIHDAMEGVVQLQQLTVARRRGQQQPNQRA